MSRAGIPVVLVHGALRSRAGMLPTALALRRRGFDARLFGYPTRRATLAQHGARLADFVAAWQRERGDEIWPVLGVMTHSMGGLVARAYLADARARAQSETQRVVMLSPPNRGAFVAEQMFGWRPFHWVYGRAAAELQPRRVAELAEPPASAQVLLLAGGRPSGERGYVARIPGNNDGLVAVDETRLRSRPQLDPVVIPSAHSWLQWRPDVIQRAAAFLGDDSPA